jgi:hypothetical protein
MDIGDKYFQSALMTNNVLAYLIECCKSQFPDASMELRVHKEIKNTNFIPNLQRNCLYCGKPDAKKRCGECRSVFYCSNECAQNAWIFHKKSCKRDLFTVCVTCGAPDFGLLKAIMEKQSTDTCQSTFLRCDHCPVKYCSQDCKNKLEDAHKKDCEQLKLVIKPN